MPTIDVDRETAHDAAVRELAKPIYPESTLSDRFVEWLNDLLHRLVVGGSSLPGGWLTVVVLGLLLLALVVTAARIARRTIRTRNCQALEDTGNLNASELRLHSEHAARQEDWASAIRLRMRAIDRQLNADGVLTPLPGRTAAELAREMASTMPERTDDFAVASRLFDDVTYGDRPGAESDYRIIVRLDNELRHHRAAVETP